MLKIGEFSKMAKITVSALRYYDKMGLLQPVFTDARSAYRYYSEEQLSDVMRIVRLREVGMPIRDIRAILCGEAPEPLLEQRKIEIERELNTLRMQKERLTALLCEPDTQSMYTAVLRDIPAYTVFSCTGVIRSSAAIHDFIRSCHSEFRRLNPDIPYAKQDYCCMIYPEESYRETNIRVEYAQAVERAGVESDFMKFRTLPAVRAVSVEHHGSDENLRGAYSFALHWARENGLHVCGAPREQYVNGAWNTPRKLIAGKGRLFPHFEPNHGQYDKS